MAIYGAFISAPYSHVAVGFFQRLFEGKTGLQAKIGQIVAMQLLSVSCCSCFNDSFGHK